MSGTLYMVATPLGNLGDLTVRAADLLRSVPVVGAEDTRRTRHLLAAIGATPRLVSLHAHSPATRIDQLIDLLCQGTDVAVVTDAGTPGISDPGVDLVVAARRAHLAVVPIPGPSAVATALSVSGLPADRYVFAGFVPRKGSARRELLDRLAAEPWTVVYFEAANRLVELLADLAAGCGDDRQVVVARELTKLHEEVRAGTLAEIGAYYGEVAPIGEVTVVLAGNPLARHEAVPVEEVLAAIGERLDAGDSRKDVVTMVCSRFGLARNDAYRLVMERS